jgi:hypothetical protein
MPFINGLEISDASGRAIIDLNAALPVPPGKSALGGMLYNNVGGIGRVQVDDSGSPAPFSSVGGFLFNANGQLQILQSLPGGAPLFVNGIRVGPLGGVAISAGGPIAGYVHGWPVTIDGALCIDSGGAGPTVVTWDPAYKGASITLSGGNLVATGAGVSNNLVRGTAHFTTGKFYYEVQVNTIGGTNYPRMGVGGSTVPVTSNGGTAGQVFALIQVSPAFAFNGNASTATGVTYVANDVMMIAVDVDTGKVWFGKNGTWILSGNPATGANPTFTLTPGTDLYPMGVTAGGSQATARFASASWGFAAPSGFGPWGGAGAFSAAFSEGFA